MSTGPSGVDPTEWRRSLSSIDRAEVAVFVSGIASMGLEILAGRIVAPEFGSSIYTWGSIIGVFLAALSLGYYLGGKRAARRATYGNLALLLLNAALYVAVLLFAADAILASGDALPVGARYASIVPVALLFGPPTFLLGFISPYAAELLGGEVGEASGRVYAVGTIGSIVGTFATTFLLIPSFEVATTELLFGVLLVATALWTIRPNPSRHALRAALVSVLLIGSFAASSSGMTLSTAVQGETVYRTQTPYQDLRVADSGGVRTLYLDDQPHSAMYLDGSNEHVFEYTRYFHLAYLLQDREEIDRVLFVGGGGFTGPKRFVAEYDATVDVVEIDPEVIDTAKRYFGVEESNRLTVYNADGREFLETTDKEYDVIVLDAYRKDQVPFHLTTVEFMRLVSDRLDDDGVVVSNVISAPRGAGSEFYRAEYETMSRVFPTMYAFSTSESNVVQNIEIVATKQDDKLSEAQLQARNDRREIGIDLDEEITHYQHDVPTRDVPVLRDEKAPVDRLLDPMLGRRYVIESTDNRTGNVTAGAVGAPAALAD